MIKRRVILTLLINIILLSSCTPNNELSSSHVNINQIELLDHIKCFQTTRENVDYMKDGSAKYENYYNFDNIINDDIDDDIFYAGLTYTYGFYCYDKNDNFISVYFDETYFSFDEKYISIKKDPDEKIWETPIFYITALEPVAKTTVTLKINDTTCSLDLKILDYQKCPDVRVSEQLEDKSTQDYFYKSTSIFMPTYQDYCNYYFGSKHSYEESFFIDKFLLSIFFVKREISLNDIYYEESFVDDSGVLHLLFSLDLTKEIEFDNLIGINRDHAYYYLFEIPKEYMNKICFSYSPVFDADFPIG